MHAHGADLRAEVEDNAGADRLVEALMRDPREADLSPVDRGLVDFAIKLTERPGAMERSDVESLRELGLDDTAISDAVMVTALFAFYNRVADGLGIDLEPDMPPPPGPDA